ncbi:MAG: CBS domain-containing protein, partial [Candidatus Sericytochromatia bacterium]
FLETENATEVSPDCLLEDACDLMIENQLHYLVVTEDKVIKGIFSSFDALGLLESKSPEASAQPAQAADKAGPTLQPVEKPNSEGTGPTRPHKDAA